MPPHSRFVPRRPAHLVASGPRCDGALTPSLYISTIRGLAASCSPSDPALSSPCPSAPFQMQGPGKVLTEAASQASKHCSGLRGDVSHCQPKASRMKGLRKLPALLSNGTSGARSPFC